MEKARRRRHVPAFGEWNYYSSSSSPDEPQLPQSGDASAAWYAPEPETCSDVWFRYSPPPRRLAPKKVRRPAVAPERLYYGPTAGGKETVTPMAGARSSGSAAAMAASTPARGGVRRVVRPVDADLYQVPPPEPVSRRSGRKKNLWMGCLGLNCVA